MKKKLTALLSALVLVFGCLQPIAVRADQTDPQVLHSQYRNEPGVYVGTIRYEYNRGGVLITEVWEDQGKEVFYDYSSNGILKNIYVDVDGENVEMKKFRSLPGVEKHVLIIVLALSDRVDKKRLKKQGCVIYDIHSLEDIMNELDSPLFGY